MRVIKDTGSLLNQWLDGLDAETLEEARACLWTGTYSRKLLLSLRAALSEARPAPRGLDAPDLAVPGDPLSATVQTLLREHLLRVGTVNGLCPVPGQRRP